MKKVTNYNNQIIKGNNLGIKKISIKVIKRVESSDNKKTIPYRFTIRDKL